MVKMFLTHDITTVSDAVYTVVYHIIPNFEDYYGHIFSEPCSLNIREIIKIDYRCPEDIAEKAMKQLDQMGVLDYQEPFI